LYLITQDISLDETGIW